MELIISLESLWNLWGRVHTHVPGGHTQHWKPIKFEMRFISPALKFPPKGVREGRDSHGPQSGRRRAQSAGWVQGGRRQIGIEAGREGEADGRGGRRGSLPGVTDMQIGEGGARRRLKGRKKRKKSHG